MLKKFLSNIPAIFRNPENSQKYRIYQKIGYVKFNFFFKWVKNTYKTFKRHYHFFIRNGFFHFTNEFFHSLFFSQILTNIFAIIKICGDNKSNLRWQDKFSLVMMLKLKRGLYVALSPSTKLGMAKKYVYVDIRK